MIYDVHICERERGIIGSHENARRVNCPISSKRDGTRGYLLVPRSLLVEAHLDTVAAFRNVGGTHSGSIEEGGPRRDRL